MTFLTVDGLRFHVQRMAPLDRAPAVGTVVLIHGVGTDSLASWYFTVAPSLAAAGMDVVMYDQRGHGRSERPATGYQVERFVADCEEVLAQLEVTGPVHAVGNSFGGTVAFGLAAARPELVASVLVVESEPASAEWAERMRTNLRQARILVDREDTFDWIAQHRGERESRLMRGAGRILATTSLALDLPASRLLDAAGMRTIGCPVLAVYGSDSPMVSQTPRLGSALPNCRSVYVAGQEHSVLVEATDEVRELALDWLAEQGVPLRRTPAEAAS